MSTGVSLGIKAFAPLLFLSLFLSASRAPQQTWKKEKRLLTLETKLEESFAERRNSSLRSKVDGYLDGGQRERHRRLSRLSEHRDKRMHRGEEEKRNSLLSLSNRWKKRRRERRTSLYSAILRDREEKQLETLEKEER